MPSARSFALLIRSVLLRSRSRMSRALRTTRSIAFRSDERDQPTERHESKFHAHLLEVRLAVRKIWTRLIGTHGRLNVRRIRKVWRLHAGVRDEYFVRVVHNACQRDSNLAANLLQHKNGKQKELRIARMAEYLYEFFDTIVAEEVLMRPSVVRDLSFNLGRKHAHFSPNTFTLTDWDSMNLAMMEELECTFRFDEVDLKAWQKLVALVHESMFCGYLRGKEDILVKERKNEDEDQREVSGSKAEERRKERCLRFDE